MRARSLNHRCRKIGNTCFIFSVRVCSLSYPTCKTHAPYYIVICDPSGYTAFFQHYLINGTNFLTRFLNIKYVFSFSLQISPKIFLILRRIQSDIIILRSGSFKLFKRPFPGFLTILTL
jgi:hypothetical protein